MKKGVHYLLIILLSFVLSCSRDHVLTDDTPLQATIDEVLDNEMEGYFIGFLTEESFAEKYFDLGEIGGLKTFAGCYRERSPWMYPNIGSDLRDLRSETQFLLAEFKDESNILMMVPYVGDVVRCCLSGRADGHLLMIAETGDSPLKANDFTGLYMISGTDPHAMIRKAWKEISEKKGTFTLREDKPLPTSTDLFGWCTYNAMYGNICHDSLVMAARNFRDKDIPVRYFIFDAGWQDIRGRMLYSYGALDSKFPEGLAHTVSVLKNDYGLDQVLVWQTLWGYWMGVDPERFDGKSRKVRLLPPPRMSYMLEEERDYDIDQEATVGPRFYPGFVGEEIHLPDYSTHFKEYFAYLKEQNVDGAKVDAMGWVELAGNSTGGRVGIMKEMMDGLQPAAVEYFGNNLINCSALSNEYLFHAAKSNITRSSPDFRPNEPASHGFHIFTNAHTSFWMGDVITPDWDMFQSGHAAGDYHAAARALSGGPVYSTEEIGTENKEVLNKLMSSDGRILRCIEPGRVCRESIFTDPTREKKLLKLYNSNRYNYVVGAFNCYYNESENTIIQGTAGISDIPGIDDGDYVTYLYSTGELAPLTGDEKIGISLGQLEYDILTFAPVHNGTGIIGITGKYNPGGGVMAMNWASDTELELDLIDGGIFTAYAEKAPVKVLADSGTLDFEYDRDVKRLTIEIPAEGKQVNLHIHF